MWFWNALGWVIGIFVIIRIFGWFCELSGKMIDDYRHEYNEADTGKKISLVVGGIFSGIGVVVLLCFGVLFFI